MALTAAALLACSPAQDADPDPIERWTTVAGADLERGRRLMAQYQCGACHRTGEVFAASGQGPAPGDLGPSLERFGRRSYIAGELPNTPERLQRWLLDPAAQVPGTPMPRLGLSAADARDIAGYLLALR